MKSSYQQLLSQAIDNLAMLTPFASNVIYSNITVTVLSLLCILGIMYFKHSLAQKKFEQVSRLIKTSKTPIKKVTWKNGEISVETANPRESEDK